MGEDKSEMELEEDDEDTEGPEEDDEEDTRQDGGDVAERKKMILWAVPELANYLLFRSTYRHLQYIYCTNHDSARCDLELLLLCNHSALCYRKTCQKGRL